MITNNVIKRVFHIKYNNNIGTCFTIDVDQKQYIVTAKHVIENCTSGQIIEIFFKNTWHKFNFNLVGHGQQHIDVSVIAINQLISRPEFTLEPSSAGIIYGQDVFF